MSYSTNIREKMHAELDRMLDVMDALGIETECPQINLRDSITEIDNGDWIIIIDQYTEVFELRDGTSYVESKGVQFQAEVVAFPKVERFERVYVEL